MQSAENVVNYTRGPVRLVRNKLSYEMVGLRPTVKKSNGKVYDISTWLGMGTYTEGYQAKVLREKHL